VHRLFDSAGRVLACYAIDESRLELPMTISAPKDAPDRQRASAPQFIPWNSGGPSLDA